MLKMLIVEDNIMTLNYLNQMIPWQDHDIQIVGAVTTGQKALIQIEEQIPDIVLTDIQMPGMDGLQLTETIKQNWPHIQIILLTAYDHFNYSQRALKAGAADYILKPLDDNELIRVIRHVRDGIMKNKEKQIQNDLLLQQVEQSLPLLKQDFYVKLITGYYNHGEVTEDFLQFLKYIFSPPDPFVVAVFAIDDLNGNTSVDTKGKEILLFALRASFEAEFPASSTHHLFFYHNQLVKFMPFPAEPTKNNGQVNSLQVFISLCSKVKGHFNKNTGYTLSAGISYLHESLEFAELAYTEAIFSLDHRFFIGKGSIIYKGDLMERANKSSYPLIAEKKICALAISGNMVELTKLLEDLEQRMQQTSAYSVHHTKSVLLGILFQSLHQLDAFESVPDQNGIKLDADEIQNLLQCETFEAAFALFKHKLLQICKYVIHLRNNHSHSIIQQAASYIRLHYDKELDVEKVAEFAGLNESYFSHLFKKVNGISFTSFLAKTRMDQAQVLLTNPSLSIIAVAEMVGIHNPRYFTQLFKKHTNMTPSEYKNNWTVDPSR